jgi:hypothetical protein
MPVLQQMIGSGETDDAGAHDHNLGHALGCELEVETPPNLCGANAKHFQISVVPMPSFSKECLGGFVGFQ